MTRAGQVWFQEKLPCAGVPHALNAAVTKDLNILQSQLQHVGVTELDGDRNVMIRPDSQPASTTCYRNWSLIFFGAGWDKPELGVKWYSPV